MKYYLILLIALEAIATISVKAQEHSFVWCFGDSSGIDFNGTNPQPFTTSLDSRGSCVSVADSNGQLLFYANTRASMPGNTTLLWNKSNQLMQNGDSIVGEGWYGELLIIPFPNSNSTYYLFSIGSTGSSEFGIFYSLIDLTIDSGLGGVILKNFQLDSFPMVDCSIAIKHGNGRDWWVIFKRSSFPFGGTNNEWHQCLVTPMGVSNVTVQNIGIPFDGNAAKLCVNSLGNKIAFVHYAGLVETYDFDRCSGIISNQLTIEYPSSQPPYLPCNECAFSPNSNILYVTTNDTVGSLLQYNLLDTNPALTKDTLWFINFPQYSVGAVRRGPDNKLYVSTAYYNGFWNYPYPDSVYNMYNMNLGVINYPDSLDTACDFQPYSFYLGGKRTYWGLPNNPDYDLGRDSGSVCDTIQWAGINEQEATGKGQLFLTYVSAWDKLFINAQHLKGTTYMLTVTDMMGRVVYGTSGGGRVTGGGYFTMDLDCSRFAQGMYIVTVTTYKEQLSKKFVKE